jgi:hypothetical protein
VSPSLPSIRSGATSKSVVLASGSNPSVKTTTNSTQWVSLSILPVVGKLSLTIVNGTLVPPNSTPQPFYSPSSISVSNGARTVHLGSFTKNATVAFIATHCGPVKTVRKRSKSERNESSAGVLVGMRGNVGENNARVYPGLVRTGTQTTSYMWFRAPSNSISPDSPGRSSPKFLEGEFQSLSSSVFASLMKFNSVLFCLILSQRCFAETTGFQHRSNQLLNECLNYTLQGNIRPREGHLGVE